EIKQLLQEVSSKRIVSHDIITPQIRKTAFEGGTQIVVNYGETDYISDAFAVKANGYTVINQEQGGE
ncbi:MAG: DUF5696 domain-containing protein, partial [Oscillospiraceae bacterium]